MKIAIVGSYGAGLTMQISRWPALGETLSGGNFDNGPGGKGSNQAVGASRLGAEVTLLTAVGTDSFGRDAHALWASEGINAEHVVDTDTPTMVAFILVEPSGDNRIVIAPGALEDLTVDHVEAFRDVIAQADLCLVSMEIPVDIAVAALRVAKEVGTTSVLNPAPASPLPDEAWDYIDVLTPNQTEGRILMGLEPDAPLDHEQVLHALRQRTAARIVLTLGKDGAMVDDGEQVLHVPAFTPRHIVDSTGAGDSFSAALSVGLCQGKSLVDAVRMGAAAGAHAVTILGVIPSLPYVDDLERILADEVEKGHGVK